MSKTYTDYFNKTALTISDSYIDVKTGNNIQISPKVKEQIEYHSRNHTLNHLLLSALHCYMHPKTANGNNDLILSEIAELKRLIQAGNFSVNPASKPNGPAAYRTDQTDLDMAEVVDVLEAFGG